MTRTQFEIKKKKRKKTKTKQRQAESSEEEGEREEQTCLSFLPPLRYDTFMHSSCVCQSRPGVVVGQFLREERGKKRDPRKGEEGKKRGREKRRLRHWAVTAGNGLIRIGVDCVPCVDSMSPQSLGLKKRNQGISLAPWLLMSHG